MDGERSPNKIAREIKRYIQPKYYEWCEEGKLTPLECRILYLKEFDDRKLNEFDQLEELKRDFGYFVDVRTYQRYWEKIKRKKIFPILP